jgi:hypothetical protein
MFSLIKSVTSSALEADRIFSSNFSGMFSKFSSRISKTKGAADGDMLNVLKPKTYSAKAEIGFDAISPQTETSILFFLQLFITSEIARSTAGWSGF